MSNSKSDSGQSALEKLEAKRRAARKKIFGAPVDWAKVMPKAAPRFEERNGKRAANNQRNIVAALTAMRVKCSDHGGLNPDLKYPGVREFNLEDDAKVQELWLEIDRRFRFKPSYKFFQIVLGDFARRMAGMEGAP
ncbi:MAG: hypothetical protein PSV22_11960 [Pseudolabrys sp.]|nr:hypothetical protein [Pseudolabrys sp.]